MRYVLLGLLVVVSACTDAPTAPTPPPPAPIVQTVNTPPDRPLADPEGNPLNGNTGVSGYGDGGKPRPLLER
jgi:hypothetical protein